MTSTGLLSENLWIQFHIAHLIGGNSYVSNLVRNQPGWWHKVKIQFKADLTTVRNNQLHFGCTRVTRESHLDCFGHAMVMSRLLSSEAFVGSVAGVREPCRLLKLIHAILSLL